MTATAASSALERHPRDLSTLGSSETISVLIAESQPLMRAGLRALVDGTPGFRAVSDVADGLAAIREARRTVPDVALVDLETYGIDGVEAIRRIVTEEPDLVGVIGLAPLADGDEVARVVAAGARGFLVKTSPPRTVLEAIRSVAAGHSWLDPTATATLVRQLLTGPVRIAPAHPGIDLLTDREREVLALAAQGLRNHEIALDLYVSPATVRTHISRAMNKLGARDRAQLVAFAYQSSLA